MKKVFSRKTKKKTQVKLTPREAETVLEKEFIDVKGNKIKFRFDFNPHPIDEPTIKWQRQYGDTE